MKCSACGAEVAGGRFCPHCGAPLAANGPATQAASAQPAQPVPPAPPGFPPAPPLVPGVRPGGPMPGQPGFPPAAPGFPTVAPVKRGGGWVKWVGIGVGVVAILIAGLAWLGRDPGPAPGANSNATPANGPAPAPNANPTPAPSQGGVPKGVAIKEIAKGFLGERGEMYAAVGPYLAWGKGNSVSFYKFDASGNASKIARLSDDNSGKLLDVAIGDLLNNGSPVVLATYEKKIYLQPLQGPPNSVANEDGVLRVVIGDYDGDGKQETIYFEKNADGKYGFDVYQYKAGQAQTDPMYSKRGVANPWGDISQIPLKNGKNDLLMGYVMDGQNLSGLLYKWDGIGGPVEIGRYPLKNTQDAPAKWLDMGATNLGPTVVLTNGGTKPTMEILALGKDFKAATSLASTATMGKGAPAVMISNFTGKDPEMIQIDDDGNYWLEAISPK